MNISDRKLLLWEMISYTRNLKIILDWKIKAKYFRYKLKANNSIFLQGKY